MLSRFSILLLLATLAASPALGMQEKPNKKKKGAARPAAKVEFTLPVSGLMKGETENVQAAFAKLSVTEFRCSGCGAVQGAAGHCEPCGTTLKEHTQALFKNVTRGKGTLTFRLAPRAHVRLSQIEEALGDGPVRIEHEKSELGKKATLVYEGGASASDATDLEKAFHAAKLTETETVLDPDSKEIHVRIIQGPVSWAQAARLGEAHARKLRLTDVIWGPMGAGKKG